MKKVLLTGITGFAGSHLAEHLLTLGDYEIVGTHVSDRHLANIEQIKEKITLHKVDLLDAEGVSRIVSEVKPDIVYHLAASTFVADSFSKPAEFITNNSTSQINVLEALEQHNLFNTKIVIVSSSHTYGYVSPEQLPIHENTPFNPDNPYSVSKITQDYLALSYFLAYKQQIVRVRPFNHIGPRLSPDISISRWAKTIALIEKDMQEPVIKVGNLTTKRDFTDVRDIVRAYVLAGELCIPGEAYNVGSGIAPSMKDMLDKLLSMAGKQITVEIDQSLFRPSDIPELRADATKFMQATGWKPEISIEKTLEDTLDYWRRVV